MPGEPDVLHLLGLVQHQKGDSEAALPLIAQALEARPDSAVYRRNQASILAALARQDRGLVAAVDYRVRPGLQGLGNQWQRGRRIAPLVPDKAEQMQHVRLARLAQQQIAIDPLGAGQVPGLL